MTASPSGPRRSFRLYLVVLFLPVALIFATSGILNYQFNPLVYDRGHIRDIAADLTAGMNYANYDPNINWRALRRAQIQQWPAAPDVIVFGGSRWWEAHADIVPGRSFKNLWVSNDQAEDALALTYLLEEAGRLPKIMVLSLRFISFQPPDEREAQEWQEWAPEYRVMAERLGIEPHSYLTTTPIRQWSSMFYAPAIYDRIQQLSKTTETPGPTTERRKQQLEVIASDGSIYWSKKTDTKYTKGFVDKAVTTELQKVGNKEPKIDRSLVDAFEKTVEYLQSKGVRVVLAQTPYHPTFWNTVKDRPFGKTLLGLESIAADMQQRHGVISIGSYDPAKVGCVAEDFIDHIHAHPACVGKVLRLVPDLAAGG